MNDNTQAILKQIGDEFGRDNLIFARIAQIITAQEGGEVYTYRDVIHKNTKTIFVPPDMYFDLRTKEGE